MKRRALFSGMGRVLLDYVLAEMGQSFDMLFANLRDLRDDDWTWVPPGGVRSIRGTQWRQARADVA